jgi:peptide/nickel transport system substrate-binding protein
MGDQFGRQPIGVGPWKFKEWRTGEKIVLERNPDYVWAPAYARQGPVYVDNLEFRFIPDTSIVLAGLEAGEIDYASVEPRHLDRLADQFTFFQAPHKGCVPCGAFNTSKPPFDDMRVRQAFNLAVDKDALIKVAAQGHAVPKYGPISHTVIGYWPGVEEIGYKFDLARAKALMEEAGYTLGGDSIYEKNGEPFKVRMKFLGENVKVAEMLKEQYRALGVDVELEQGEFGVVYDQVTQGDYEFALFGYTWREGDVLWIIYHSQQIGILNLNQVNDPELDALLDASRTELDVEKRIELLGRAQERIVEQAYMLPLYTPFTFYALNNRVKGAEWSEITETLYVHDAYIE